MSNLFLNFFLLQNQKEQNEKGKETLTNMNVWMETETKPVNCLLSKRSLLGTLKYYSHLR